MLCIDNINFLSDQMRKYRISEWTEHEWAILGYDVPYMPHCLPLINMT